MFEHKDLDGNKHRTFSPAETFVSSDVLETREPKNGQSVDKAGRLQHAVIEAVLVERFLPPESIGDKWGYEPSTAWWEVVGHPPHGGIVADFNSNQGGAYQRELNTEDNVVGFAESGEKVVMTGSDYKVVREKDSTELVQPSFIELRKAYYA